MEVHTAWGVYEHLLRFEDVEIGSRTAVGSLELFELADGSRGNDGGSFLISKGRANMFGLFEWRENTIHCKVVRWTISQMHGSAERETMCICTAPHL